MHAQLSTSAALLLALISSTSAQESSSSSFRIPGPMEQSLTTTITDASTVAPSDLGAIVTALSGTRTESETDDSSLTAIMGTNTDAEAPSSGSTTIAVLTSSTSSSSDAAMTEESSSSMASTTTMVGDPGNPGQTGVGQSQTTQNAGMPVMGVGMEQAVMLGLGAGAALLG